MRAGWAAEASPRRTHNALDGECVRTMPLTGSCLAQPSCHAFLPFFPTVNFPCVAGKYRPRRDGEPPYVVGNDLALQDANRVAYRAVYENHIITNPEAVVRCLTHRPSRYAIATCSLGPAPASSLCAL